MGEGDTVQGFTDRAMNAAADRELVREAIVRHLKQVFGPDNATRYEDEPFRIGVSFTDGVVIDVRINDPSHQHTWRVEGDDNYEPFRLICEDCGADFDG